LLTALSSPTYGVEAKLRLLPVPDSVGSGQSSESPERRLANGAQLLQSDVVLGAAAEQLGTSTEQLRSSIEVTASEDADVLTVTSSADRPLLAQRRATEVVAAFVQTLAARDAERRQGVLTRYTAQIAQLNAALAQRPPAEEGEEESVERTVLLEQIATLTATRLQAEVAQGPEPQLVEELTRPGVPGAPTSFTIARALLLGVVLGSLVGLSAAVLRDLTTDPVHTADELQRLVPPDAEVLVLPHRRRLGKDDFDESMRTLAAYILPIAKQRANGRGIVVAVGNTDRRVGTGSIAEALAGSLGSTGHTVLLVDTDLRWAGGPTPGLSDTLARLLTGAVGKGQADASDQLQPDRQIVLEAVRKTSAPGVTVLPVGSTSGSVDLLASEASPRFLHVARQLFDVIVLEVAPAPQYADLLNVAPLVDGLVLLIRTEGTSRRRVLEVCERVERLGKPVDVAVLAKSMRGVPGLDVRPLVPAAPDATVAPGSRFPSTRRPAPSGSHRDL